MDRRHSICCGLALALIANSTASAWDLGGPAYQQRYYPPASWYGYSLDERNPTYYGGASYRENYTTNRNGFGIATFPGAWYVPFRPYFYNRPVPPYALSPSLYVPTSELFRRPQAYMIVHVPEDAEVWLEGEKMTKTGAVRSFVSPPLEPGEAYGYTIRARWMEGGQPVEQVQKVVVHRGDRRHVGFPTQAKPELLPVPRAEPAK